LVRGGAGVNSYRDKGVPVWGGGKRVTNFGFFWWKTNPVV